MSDAPPTGEPSFPTHEAVDLAGRKALFESLAEPYVKKINELNAKVDEQNEMNLALAEILRNTQEQHEKLRGLLAQLELKIESQNALSQDAIARSEVVGRAIGALQRETQQLPKPPENLNGNH